MPAIAPVAKGKSKAFLRDRRLALVMIAPTMLTLFAITIYPTLYSLWVSLHGLVLTRPQSTPFLGLENYVDVLRADNFWESIRVTLTITVVSVGIQFVVGLGLALLFNREFVGKRVVFPILLLPLMVTPIVVGLMWRYMYNGEFGIIAWALKELGVENYSLLTVSSTALPGVILADVWEWTPFLFLLFLAGLQALPPEPFEAARVDGSSTWQTFRNITLPMLKPVILIGLLLRIMDSLKMFDIVYIMTQGGPGLATETFAMQIFREVFKFFFVGKGAAMSLMMLIAIILLSKLFIRLFRERTVEEV